MVFLKPVVFSGSFSEHSSSMNEGGTLQILAPMFTGDKRSRIYSDNNMQVLSCGFRWAVGEGQQWSGRNLPLASSSSSPVWLLFFLYLACQVHQLCIFPLSLTYILEVPPFHFATLWQLHLCSPFRLLRSQTSYLGVRERTPT